MYIDGSVDVGAELLQGCGFMLNFTPTAKFSTSSFFEVWMAARQAAAGILMARDHGDGAEMGNPLTMSTLERFYTRQGPNLLKLGSMF